MHKILLMSQWHTRLCGKIWEFSGDSYLLENWGHILETSRMFLGKPLYLSDVLGKTTIY